MEGSPKSNDPSKPWDHAWSTEEMRDNRGNWSLAADVGLLKHLEAFAEKMHKKADETRNAVDKLNSDLTQTGIFVDNLTNISFSLANTQYIENVIQEDNPELEKVAEQNAESANKVQTESNASDSLADIFKSIDEGLKIMDKYYDKLEVEASDSEDEDESLPSVIWKQKDPYQHRPLPYVIGSEKWEASKKVGLETSSSESDQNDEESESDSENKNISGIQALSSTIRTDLGRRRLSSTSSESNDYNIESSSIKNIDKGRLYARSQDTLSPDTEPTTPSSILSKNQNINIKTPSFAEELAKRLTNVAPPSKNVSESDSNDQIIKNSIGESQITVPQERNVFNSKSDNLFSKADKLFADERVDDDWRNTKPLMKPRANMFPSSEEPPPLSVVSSAPKSNIDDLFGDADDSDDSDDIFSGKSSKNIFSSAAVTSSKMGVSATIKNKNLKVENVQNINTMATSTPETNDRAKGLFDDDEDDEDLFGAVSKQPQVPVESPSSTVTKKKPIGGVSIFGQVDILASSKFPRRASSSSSSSNEDEAAAHGAASTPPPLPQPRAGSTSASTNSINAASATNATTSRRSSSSNAAGGAASSTFQSSQGNNSIGNSALGNVAQISGNNSSSGVFITQPSMDSAGSSLGADFQPLMSSSRLKSEEIYRERIVSDSLLKSRTRNNSSDQQIGQPQQQQQQQQQQRQQLEPTVEDASRGSEDVFGPPPLSADSGSRNKSKVTSLFDDSDSGDDLFGSASTSSRGTPSRSVPPSSSSAAKKKSIFDDDEDDLFGPPRDDLFTSGPTASTGRGLFDQDIFGGKKNKPEDLEVPTPAQSQKNTSLFPDESDALFPKPAEVKANKGSEKKAPENESKIDSTDHKLPSTTSKQETQSKLTVEKIVQSTKPVAQKNIFSDDEADNIFERERLNAKEISASSEKSLAPSELKKNIFSDEESDDLFDKDISKINVKKETVSSANISSKTAAEEKKQEKVSQSKSSLFSDDESADLFGAKVSKPTVKKTEKAASRLFDDDDEPDLFVSKPKPKLNEKDSLKDLFGNKPSKSKKLTSSIFDVSDDDDDLFGNPKEAKTLPSDKKPESKTMQEEKSDVVGADLEKANIPAEQDDKKVAAPTKAPTVEKKPDVKPDIFDDEDDDDDLFGDKKKKKAAVAVAKEIAKNVKEQSEKAEAKPKPMPSSKPEITPKKAAILADLKSKLEKHRQDMGIDKPSKAESLTGAKSLFSPLKGETPESSVVDGLGSSKPEPPKSLKLKITTPPPSVQPSEGPSSPGTPGTPGTPKKPVVSGKIKNLMGKMNDLKILSPNDTPPLFRKNKEENNGAKNEDEKEATNDDVTNSEESTPSFLSGASSPLTSEANSKTKDSPSVRSENTETAISLDEPVQPETLLSIEKSKSRARIPKRRPQSREARQIAIRNSGIDFDIVDASGSPTREEPQVTNGQAQLEQGDSLAPPKQHDDRSELSLSKNTTTNLLSPSTDEEDLFDVPPELPEDPSVKEDTLFDKGPVLSPVMERKKIDTSETKIQKKKEIPTVEKKDEQPIDPLRNDKRDPIDDHSSLFAFVTKTPSPQENKNLLPNDDDSLFKGASKNSKAADQKLKPTLNLFEDDDASGSDLFSTSKTKLKKPLKDTKIDLFDDTSTDDNDDLFGASKKKPEEKKAPPKEATQDAHPKATELKSENKAKETNKKDIFETSSDEDDIFAKSKKVLPKRNTLFDEIADFDDDEDLFGKPKSAAGASDSKTSTSDKSSVRRIVKKDLSRTVEKDPLSLLQDE